MDILKVFWEIGEAPVKVVHQKMAPNGEFALTTIQTIIRIMERKGFLKARGQNRTSINRTSRSRTLYYTPVYTIEQFGSRFLHKVFDGAVDRLVLSMLRAQDLSADELREIELLVAKMREAKQKEEQS